MAVFKRNPAGDAPRPLRAISGSAAPVTPSVNPFKKSALPFTAHRNLTAAATLVDVTTAEGRTQFAKRRASAQGWQDEAWLYADAIGEISYAFSVVANALSRVRLYTAQVVDPAALPVSADPDSQTGQASIEVLEHLNSAFGGIPGLLRDAAMNIQIAGECVLVQRPANPFTTPPTPESWDIRSVDELQVDANGNMIIVPREDGDRSAAIKLPKNAYVARIWRPHPRWSDSSTSSVRAVLDLCAELMLLNKTFRSIERSRLNAGMLYLPDGLSVAASGDQDPFAEEDADDAEGQDSEAFPAPAAFDAEELEDNDDFEEALIEAMITPIADEESASAVVPLIVRGPAELGEKIRLIQFERGFEDTMIDRSEKLLDRIMQGLDVPKEIVKGLSALKFSTAQIVDTQLYQAHVEPLALLICDALTTVYLRPALRSLGLPEDEIAKHVIWYDPSEVTTRPNRAEDADKGFENHLISGASWRRAHNFTDDDAPTSTELALRILLDKGTISPDLAESLLTVIAPEVMQAVRDASAAANPAAASNNPAVQDILQGGTGAPTDPAAAGAAPIPADTPADSAAVDPEAPADEYQGPPGEEDTSAVSDSPDEEDLV